MGNGLMKSVPAMFLLVWISCMGCDKNEQSFQQNEAGIPVLMGQVETKDVIYSLHQVGTLKAKQSVMIKSEVEGKIIKIFFREGDAVKSGMLLVKLDDSKIIKKIDRLQARMAQLKIQLANSKRTLERKRPLAKEDLVSKQNLDDLESKIKIEQASIREVGAELDFNREIFKDTEIRSPFPGVTSEKVVNLGGFLKVGDPVVMVVQLDPLEISFRADEKYKPRLYLKQPITITVSAYPERRFSGEVCFVSPDIDVSTRSFLVKGLLLNHEKLLNPGMFAEIAIVTEVHKNALIVPWESVIQLENETYLYKIDDDNAIKVPIKLGLVFNDGTAEVSGDLKPGEKIVTEGKFALYDHARIKVK